MHVTKGMYEFNNRNSVRLLLPVYNSRRVELIATRTWVCCVCANLPINRREVAKWYPIINVNFGVQPPVASRCFARRNQFSSGAICARVPAINWQFGGFDYFACKTCGRLPHPVITPCGWFVMPMPTPRLILLDKKLQSSRKPGGRD